MLDSTICNVHTQSEFTDIPAEFSIQNLEGNPLKQFCFGILAFYESIFETVIFIAINIT